jgi:ABC-2 type transport system permease protein
MSSNGRLLDHGPGGWGTAPPAGRAVVADWLTMAGRCLRLTRRNPDAVLTSLALPVMLMLLFVYLFGGAIQTGTRYVTYVVPGVLLLCAGFGASMTAVSVTNDMGGGIIDRFRSLDVAGASVLAGHVVASVVRNLASTVLVFGVAFLIGFRPSAGPLDWLAAVAVLLLFILAISWLAAAVGLLARSPEAAGGFSFLVMFLPYPSSAFVPIETMPSWLHGFAGNQPVTPVIETLRGLLLGLPVGASPWKAAAWCLGILVASVAASGVLFRRRTA